MITIRKMDYRLDVPKVVSLLRKGLNEDHSIKKFKWKHIDNPFGVSLGMLAFEKNKLVGVRMFMRWNLKRSNEIIKAYRPVDTVTHSDYRRRGIFERLNIEGLKFIENDCDIIFNTPNKNSSPGNLKLGWSKMKIDDIYVLVNLSFIHNSKGFSCDLTKVRISEYDSDKNSFTTEKSQEFLVWRYASSEYRCHEYRKESGKVLVVYKIKKVKSIKMVVVLDLIGTTSMFFSAIKDLSRKKKVLLIYFMSDMSRPLGFSLALKRPAPQVLFKNDKRRIAKSIELSLGDIEGRI